MADFQTTVELKAQTGQLNQKLDKVNRKLKNVSTQVRKTQGAFTRMGQKVSGTFNKLNRKIKEHRTAIAGIGISLGLVVAKGVKDFKEWEDGLTQIATLGVTGISAISDELDNVRREFGITGAEATKGYYDIISAGASQGAEAMSQLTAATKLAKAGNTDLAGAIDVVTSGINIFGDNGETATSIVDQLFLAVKYGKTTVEELGKTFGYVAPVIDAAGLSMADYAASMATVTAGGIATKQATTGLKAVLSNLIKVTPKAAKKAKELGIDFGVGALKAKGLVGVMQDIANAVDGDVSQLGHLFDSIEAINAVAVLTSNTGLASLERNFNAMSDSAGTTEEALAKVKATASYNFGKFNQGLSIMSRSIGAAVVPSLLSMTEALGPVVEFIAALITQHPGIIKMTSAVVGLTVALAFLGGPVTLAILGVGVALKKLSDHFELFADGGVAALEKIELVWDNFWAGFADKNLGESINHIFSGIGNWIETLLPEGGFSQLWTDTKIKLDGYWTSISDWFTTTDWESLWTGTLEFVGDIWSGVKTALIVMWVGVSKWFQLTDWNSLWEGTLEFVGDIWSGVKTALNYMWTNLVSWFKTTDWSTIWSGQKGNPHATGGVLGFVGDIWGGVKSALTVMWNSLTAWFNSVDWAGLWAGTLNFVGDVWAGVKSGLTSMWSSLTTWFDNKDWAGLWTDTLNFVGNVWEGVKAGLSSMWTSLTNWFDTKDWDGLWSNTLNFVGDVWSGVKTGLTAMWKSLTEWFDIKDWDGLWAGTLNFVGDIWSSVKNHLVSMWVGIDLWFQTADWGKLWDNTLEFTGDIWSGVKSALNAMWNGITGWFSSINWKGLWFGVGPHGGGLLEFTGDIWQGMKNALSAAWTNLTTWFANADWKGLWEGTLEFTGKVWDGIKVVLDAAWTGITNWFNTTDWDSLWTGTLEFVGNVWTGIKTALSTMWTSLSDWFTTTDWATLWDNTLQFTGEIWSGVKPVLDDTWASIESWFSGLDWAGVGETVRAGMKASFTGIGDIFAGILGEEETVGGDRLAAGATGVLATGKIVSKVWPMLQQQFAVLSARIAAYLAPLGAGVLSGPVGWVLLGAVAVGGLTYAFWPQIKSFFTDMWDDLTAWFSELDWGGIWDGMVDGLLGIGPKIINTIKGWFDFDFWPFNGSSDGAPADFNKNGIKTEGLASGGSVSGAGTGTSDSIPAMLSDGEYVINAKSTKLFGPLLEALNAQKFARGGMVGGANRLIQKFAGGGAAGQGGTVGDAKSYQFLQFEEGIFSMSATIDRFIGNMDATDPAVNKVVRQLEYLQKHTGNLNEEQVLQHDYATRINLALIDLLPKKKEEAEVTSEAAGAVKDLGDAAKKSADTIVKETNEWEGTAQSFTGPIKQALSSGGDVGDAFKQGIKGMLQRISSKLLDRAFAPLEAGIDKFLNNMLSGSNSLFGGGGGGGGGFLSSILGGGSSVGGGGGLGSIGGMLFGMSKGGIVPKLGMKPQYFANGGMAKGTDTVPAMLTPGEMVLNKQQQEKLLAGQGGDTYNFNIEATDANSFKRMLSQDPKFLSNIAEQGKQAKSGLRRAR